MSHNGCFPATSVVHSAHSSFSYPVSYPPTSLKGEGAYATALVTLMRGKACTWPHVPEVLIIAGTPHVKEQPAKRAREVRDKLYGRGTGPERNDASQRL